MSPSSSPRAVARTAARAAAAAAIVLACGAAARPPAGQPAPAASPPPIVVAPVHIHGMTYDRARHSLVLTITGAVTISTRALKAPPRLVVDIPSASLDSANRELVVKDELVTRVRVSQFKIFPPMVRVVIETATEQEPLIAVQQTGRRLYITLAPARPGEEPSPAGVLPSPGPEPSDFTPPTITETPLPVATAPAWTPTARPATPRWVPTAAPTLLRPSALPSNRPGINTRLRPGQPLPTPRRSGPPDTLPPGSEWQDLFPQATPRPATPRPVATPYRPIATPTPYRPAPTPFRPSVAPTPFRSVPTPLPFGTPFGAPSGEPTPIPPPRGGLEEPGNETYPTVP